MTQTSSAIRQKFVAAIATCQTALVGRDEAVSALFLAVLANEHATLLGEPGTAKSEVVNNVLRCFQDAKTFSVLVNQYVPPDEFVGPVNVAAFKLGSLTRNTTGYMPEADFVFLDEGFKAAPAQLNMLLTMLNERQFDAGQRPSTDSRPSGRVAIPLRSTFIASNEVPDDPLMRPFWDRIAVRLWIEPIHKNPDLFDEMMRNNRYPVRTESRRKARSVANVIHKITLAELDAAQAEMELLPYAAATFAAYSAIKDVLAADPVLAGVGSDRSFLRLFYTLPAAAAWLSGATSVEPEHLECLKDTLWNEPGQRRSIVDAIFKFANPMSEEVRRIEENVMEIAVTNWPTVALDNGDSAAQKSAVVLVEEIKGYRLRLEGLVASHAKYAGNLRKVDGYLAQATKSLQASVMKSMGIKLALD
jgi:MoxR-like ATPase